MNILNHILKARLEKRNGRIHTFPGNWVFKPTPAQVERTIARNQNSLLERVDADGVKMVLIHQRSVRCPRADLCQGKYPRSSESERWFLPLHVCRKCEHHQKGGRRGTPRYPCCKYQASDNPQAEAVADTMGIFNEAVEQANKIMGN